MPSIGALRNAIQEVTYRATYAGENEDGDAIFDTDVTLPTLNYRGSVKLHGTNAAIAYRWNILEFNYETQFQSKGNIITPLNDNNGFAAHASTINTDALLAQIMKVKHDMDYTPETVRVYGEWCGGNIQKKCAVNGLPKMFVIIGIKIDNIWLTGKELSSIKRPDDKVYNIMDYETFNITVDFNNPKVAADAIVELVDKVEAECPVGKAFGIEGGVGEGIVWVCETEGWTSSRFWFKTKGDLHEGKKGDKKKNQVPIDIERVASIEALVDTITTEGRMIQGFDQLRENNLELSRKSTGFYVNWVYGDVIKEELDTIMGNGFEPKDVKGAVCAKARKYYFTKLDEGYGL